ncbi:MAG: hypothetical protein V3S64_05465, partial [bacterium]
SAGLDEKISVLAGEKFSSPALQQSLAAHAKIINVNFKRMPEQVRKAFFQDALRALEGQKLPETKKALIDEVFDAYLQSLRSDLAGAIGRMVEEVEEKNGQINFLPPDELPQYLHLRQSNPLHHLRSAKLRLAFLLETMGAMVEAFDGLEAAGLVPSPMLEEQMEGYLSELRTQNLARPYLVPDVQLSDELAARKAAFPFEVHALLARMPGVDNPEKAFKSLSRKLANSIYQRLYTALLLLRAWIKALGQGKDEEFRAGERFKTLKGLMANFRFRRPLLETLYFKIGIVQELAESEGAGGDEPAERKRFPTAVFAQAWGQFMPHAVLAGYCAARGDVPGFDGKRYWAGVDEALLDQTRSEPGAGHLAYALRQLHLQAGEEGLRVLPELLANPTGTFRFMVGQALAAPREKDNAPAKERAEFLARIVGVVLQARSASRRNAIVIESQP